MCHKTLEKFSYQTIKNPVLEVLLKEKGSKFLGFAFPVNNENEVKHELEKIRALHPKATHHCYAFRLGLNGENHRANDDGEPGGSAGLPIYNQLLSYDVSNILLIVVRYYGGTKLGVGGLVKTYRESAKLTLDQAEIVTREIESEIKITFAFNQQNQVFTILNKHHAKILDFSTENHCVVRALFPKMNQEQMIHQLSEFHSINFEIT